MAALGYQQGRHQVYNIEVEAEHCYFVGDGQTLTHNMCPTESANAKQAAGDTRDGVTYMDPKEIEKSHPMNAAGRFGDAKHGSVGDLANNLKSAPTLPSRIPPIEVAKVNRKTYSENNKRLTAFQMAGKPVPTVPAGKIARAKITQRVNKRRK